VSGEASTDTNSSPAALYEAALLDFQSGQMQAAEERCHQALIRAPNHAASLHLLGLICARTDRLGQAIDFIARAVRDDPTVPDYFSNLGTLLQRQDRFEEALKSYDLALRLKPDAVGVWISVGSLLRRQKRYCEALLAYDHVLTLDARNVEAANMSGLLLIQMERFEEALARFDLLQAIEPVQAEVFDRRAVCLSRLERREEAVASYRRSLEVGPQNYQTHNSLGLMLLDSGRSDEALVHFRQAIAIKPDFIAAINNLGLSLVNLKRFEESLAIFDEALSIASDVAELYCSRASAFRGLNRYHEAVECYERAIALKPDYLEAHINFGTCLDDMMRANDALSSYHRAIEIQTDYAEAHWNIAINRLRAGDFETGWLESEWRWKCPALRLDQRMFTQPLWLGEEPIDGKSLLLHSDAGLGDTLQFCRYVPLAAARGAQVILEVQPALRKLLSGLAGVSRLVAKGEALPNFDFHCPLGSLPLAFNTSLETIPSAVPYLSVGDRTSLWKDGLDLTRAPRIGLVWSGNPNHGNDHNRSISLRAFLPLLDLDAQFISLQKELRPEDRATLRGRNDILDFGPNLDNFADTAELIKHLDLVISVDTSVAHLAGALGRPLWILLPYVPDWRWLVGRDNSPWYPTARLFRQTETREYGSVIERVRSELATQVRAAWGQSDRSHQIGAKHDSSSKPEGARRGRHGGGGYAHSDDQDRS
jgi:tetratricopeptide (TPR) repeat protein